MPTTISKAIFTKILLPENKTPYQPFLDCMPLGQTTELAFVDLGDFKTWLLQHHVFLMCGFACLIFDVSTF